MQDEGKGVTQLDIFDLSIPWLIHVNAWQKPLQYCKVISLQLIKINGKKNHLQHCLQRGVAIYLTADQQSRLCCGLPASGEQVKSRADAVGKHACSSPSHFSLLVALTLPLLRISQLVILTRQIHAMGGEVERLRDARYLLSSRFAKPALDYLPPYFS